MKHLMVRYKVKPEAVDENRRLIEAVYEALNAQGPQDIGYLTFELDDGSFVHVKTDAVEGAFDLPDLPAFKAFTQDIRERCEESPKFAQARVVGRYGIWAKR
jgi:hypothetical protein